MNRVEDVLLGEGKVVIKRAGVSTPTVAEVLGIDVARSGAIKAIYLNSLVHGPRETEFGPYAASGATSTVLTAR